MSGIKPHSPFKKVGTVISTKVSGDLIASAALGTGVDAAKFLRGDQTWQAAGGGTGELNMAISSSETVNILVGKHLQYLTAGDNVLTIDGILQVDGSFVFVDLGV